MKTEINQTIMDELSQVLSPEDTILDSLEPQSKTAKKAEKKLNINNSILLDIITDQTRANLIWKCVAVLLVICVVAVAFMYFNLYKSNKFLNVRAANTAKLETKLSDSKAEAEKLKTDILQVYSELTNTRNELNNSKTETAKLQEKLDEVNGQLKNLQDRNAEVVKILNGRLQKLSTSSDTKR